MTERRVGRRRVLAALAGVGGIGAVTGSETAALLRRNRGLTDSEFTAGAVDLAVDWSTGADSGSSEGVAAFGLELAPGETETVDLSVVVPDGNPVYGWLRSLCTDTGADLADELTLSLGYGRAGETLYDGPLTGAELAAGLPLDAGRRAHVDPGAQTCLRPGEPLDLTLAVSLSDYWEPGAVQFGLEFVGVQCRNTDGTTSPFDGTAAVTCETAESTRYGISYIELFVAEDGSTHPLAKLELPDSYVEPGTYHVRDEDGEQTGYRVEILEARTKDDGGDTETTGVALAVIGPDGDDPTLARVDIKGGPRVVTYTDDTGALDGNESDGVLMAPRRNT